jgi:hypothetical protein
MVSQPGGPEGVEEEEVEEEAVLSQIGARLTAVQPRSDICMIQGNVCVYVHCELTLGYRFVLEFMLLFQTRQVMTGKVHGPKF